MTQKNVWSTNLYIYMDINTDHFTLLVLHARGNNRGVRDRDKSTNLGSFSGQLCNHVNILRETCHTCHESCMNVGIGSCPNHAMILQETFHELFMIVMLVLPQIY